MSIRNNIRYYRAVLGISQLELALRCGISQNAISDLERGVYRPTLDTACTIADILHQPLRSVFPIYIHKSKKNVDTL